VLLHDITLPDGRRATVELAADRIESVVPAPDPADVDHAGAADVIDGDGWLLLPAPAEPHAHLDKALTADRVPNPDGDLMGAVRAWLAHRPTITRADFAERATAALHLALAHGVTAVRTHVDLGVDVGTTAVEALLEVKAALAPRLDLQLVGLVSRPTGGPEGAGNRAVLRDALDLGLDVVGGCPHLDDDPVACLDATMELASAYGRPLDLHTDENLDPDSHDLEILARRVLATGFEHGVVASHCVSLGMRPPDEQDRVAALVAEAGIAVVTLPQTNLFLQAREQRTAPPRGLTALAALESAGVLVAGGGDNLQDPFCTVGRGDPLETAALLVMAGHLTPEMAYDYVSNRARQAMGLPPVELLPGHRADLLLVRARSVREAVASAPPERIVIRAGQVVARTTVEREFPPAR
jgi:cytosine/creatinine deaminase